ncbi:TPA: restriction endonuclease subunit S [Vibrio harveyi]|nr:restriction endonuclease subunit S [Vibrio harveyi]HDM8180607.1 restriction endonuclease subunit S [Vibrio harveyi]
MSNVVPEGWAVTSIGELTKKDSLFSDGDWVESKDQDPNGSNRLIQLADIGDGLFINKSSRYLNDEQFERLNCTTLRKNDVLVARMPEPLGRACLYPLDNARAATIVDIAIIRTPNADHKWLMSAINSSDYRADIELNASGTTRTRIARGALSKLKLIAPPLPEQKKIAAILTSVDDVIEKTQAQIDKLKDLKTGMMQELLTSGVGVDGKPHSEFKDSPVGRIPKGWDCCLLDKVARRGSGHTPDKKKSEYWNDGVKWVSLTDSSKLDKLYISDTAKKISQLGIENSSATLHPKGTVVMARDAGVGKSAIMTSSMAVSQHFMAWVCGEKLDNYFLYYLLQHWKPQFEAIAMGSTIKTIGLPYFKKLQIPVPSIEEQRVISGALKSVDNKMFALERKHKQLTNTKKALMQDLLTGKVRVKVEG